MTIISNNCSNNDEANGKVDPEKQDSLPSTPKQDAATMAESPSPQHATPPEHPSPRTQPARALKKVRLDLLLVDRGLTENQEQAKRLIMAGEVLIEEEVRDKPGQLVAANAAIRVRTPLPYVSRGGLKLAGALDAFQLDVTDLTAIDVGASTGGFTDCLLQRGVARVFAIDVGYGQLAWKLRNDSRVIVMERTNIRTVTTLPQDGQREDNQADLAVIDASFISLALVLPATIRLLRPRGEVIALIKPQFEADKEAVGRGGVVREEHVHRAVLEENYQLANQLGLTIQGMILSPLLGPAGNVEFLVWYRSTAATLDTQQYTQPSHTIDVPMTIEMLLAQTHLLRKTK